MRHGANVREDPEIVTGMTFALIGAIGWLT